MNRIHNTFLPVVVELLMIFAMAQIAISRNMTPNRTYFQSHRGSPFSELIPSVRASDTLSELVCRD